MMNGKMLDLAMGVGFGIFLICVGLMIGWGLWGSYTPGPNLPTATAQVNTPKGLVTSGMPAVGAAPLATLLPGDKPRDTGVIRGQAKPVKASSLNPAQLADAIPAATSGSGWVCPELDVNYLVATDKKGNDRLTFETDNGKILGATQLELSRAVEAPRVYPNHLILTGHSTNELGVVYLRDLRLPWLGDTPLSFGGGYVNKEYLLAASLRW